jgi:PhzF family phenazine biosynthesis protein
MPDYGIRIVDAFTTRRYAGNPAGVVTRAEGLTDAQMQAIAREMNLSETAFVFPSQVADFRVRFFTPATEIPLAGNPTIATMHAPSNAVVVDDSATACDWAQAAGASVVRIGVDVANLAQLAEQFTS